MNTKHTPGEWKQDGIYIDAPDGALIATVHSEDSTENEHNGRIIAASLDLLEACAAAMETRHINTDGTWTISARAASMIQRAVDKATN